MGGTDLRPRVSLSLRGRRFDHWTPRYLYYRGRQLLRKRLRPGDPSLTHDAVRLLASRLRPDHVGVEWGSGNSTRWFAERTRHLTSFESAAPYYDEVRAALAAAGVLRNVEYRLIPFQDNDDEEVMHRSEWVRAAGAFDDASLDYALVDSSPRGCLCAAIAPKLKPGGLLILDNANWYMPPPVTLAPPAPGSTPALLGTPGSAVPRNRCWPAFAAETARWETLWSSDGVQTTLVLVKP